MERSEEYLLSIKVNRVVLNEPKDVGHFVSQEEFEQFTRAKQNDFQPEYELPVKIADKWRVLGKRFTKTYLGEAISFYLCITNDSVREDVTDVSIQVDLQLSNNRVLNLGCFRTERLEAKNSIQQIFHHEVKDLDKHLLIFTINYKLESNEIQAFRKTFQFWAEKPLDIKTKFYNAENNEVYLEATLQNLSVVPICLETVALEPSEFFTVRDMNFVEDIDCAAQPALAVQNATVNATTTKRLVFGRVNRFNSTDSRQYLFCLLPKAELCGDVIMMHKINSIGKLDIMWTSAIGTKGRLQTPQLERVVPKMGDLKLDVQVIASQVDLKAQFNVKFSVTNCSEKEIDPILLFDNKAADQTIFWLGISGISLDKLVPNQSTTFDLIAYPTKSGLQLLSPIIIQDRNMKEDYAFDEIAFVFVK